MDFPKLERSQRPFRTSTTFFWPFLFRQTARNGNTFTSAFERRESAVVQMTRHAERFLFYFTFFIPTPVSVSPNATDEFVSATRRKWAAQRLMELLSTHLRFGFDGRVLAIDFGRWYRFFSKEFLWNTRAGRQNSTPNSKRFLFSRNSRSLSADFQGKTTAQKTTRNVELETRLMRIVWIPLQATKKWLRCGCLEEKSRTTSLLRTCSMIELPRILTSK